MSCMLMFLNFNEFEYFTEFIIVHVDEKIFSGVGTERIITINDSTTLQYWIFEM